MMKDVSTGKPMMVQAVETLLDDGWSPEQIRDLMYEALTDRADRDATRAEDLATIQRLSSAPWEQAA